MIAGLLSVLLTVWLPYEAVFDERRLMMWDRVDAVAGAVVRRQLDWPWYMLEAVVFVGVLWLLNADKSGFPFWVGRVFRYGIVVWCVFVVAGSLLGWRMARVRQRMWPTWRYWYRNGVIASFVVACVCIAMMCWAFSVVSGFLCWLRSVMSRLPEFLRSRIRSMRVIGRPNGPSMLEARWCFVAKPCVICG